jgi:chromosome partitioning protein
MRTISIYNKKGGTGKTSFVTNVGYALSMLGRTVVIVDCDSQANSSALIPAAYSKPTLTHVIREHVPLLEAMYQARQNLFVVPADTNLGTAANHILVTEDYGVLIDRVEALSASLPPRSEESVSRVLEGRKQVRLRDIPLLEYPIPETLRSTPMQIDYLLFDHAPNPNSLTRAALYASEEIIVPCELEPYAAQGLSQMIMELTSLFRKRRQQIRMSGIIPFNLDHRRSITTPYLVDLWKTFQLLTTRSIHTDATVPNAQARQQTVFEYEKGSRIAKEIFALALWMEGFIGTFADVAPCKLCAAALEQAQARSSEPSVEG